MPQISHLANNQDNLVCSFSTRKLQNMSFVYGDTLNSLQNRQDFLQELRVNYQDLVCAKQIHSNRVRYVQEEDKGKGALSYADAIDGTDGFITDKRDLPLAIFTADCLSIFLYTPKAPAIGLIHAGWRSTKDEITAETIKQMQERFNISAVDLYADFGPAIRNCCYEVGREFGDVFAFGIIKRENRYYLDLVAINKKQLLDSGVKEANIFDSKICTSCRNSEFFSYRKEGNSCGRMMSVMMLK